ncbi:UvrD-helicase domain-containing protein [Collimonas pratensis]|uniref:DNA 3'-5' helicase II n=1 Tax=Collimonas pratensis TaxID=279113 RepID=A0A127Q7W7_9BURK|nr:UvrD-helicase domain-containing protein [Collimonas pratensis]AMP06133.1 uvrD/REP helicase N-terminal domain protein [Collimonas pratensis]
MWDDPIDEKIYGYLNFAKPESFMLLAGAGSGKTKTLVAVLEAIKQEHASRLALDGQRVAIITYTNAACEEIKDRLKRDPAFSVSTIHSFSWELIKSFTPDIRAWLREKFVADIAKLDIDIGRARDLEGVTARRNIRSREGKKKRLESLDTVLSFSYTPNSISTEVGSVHHSEVVGLAAYFLANEPLMGRILVNQFPILLIDETQDTNAALLDALIAVQAANSKNFSIGLFGDMMQQIFGGGKTDLVETLPVTWLRPEKKINYRCPRRVITLINKIRLLDDPHQQHPGPDCIEGAAILFIASSDSAKSKAEVEAIARQEMVDRTNDAGWESKLKVKTLTLEHHMAAVRGGFDDFLVPFLGIDHLKDAALSGDSKEIKFIRHVFLPLIIAIKSGDDFATAKVVRDHSPLLKPAHLRGHADPIGEIRAANIVVEHVATALAKNPECSIISVLKIIEAGNLLTIPDDFLPYLIDKPKGPEEGVEDNELESAESKAWDSALSAAVGQAERYVDYISDSSNYDTHQGVKGLQYERVMVVLDDAQARGSGFSYEKLLGAKALSADDLKNEREGKDTAVKKSRRLLYVTCSRAQKSLAVVAYSKDPQAIKDYVVKSKWFEVDEVVSIE